MKKNMLYQGAEAVILLKDSKLLKERIAKSYRLPVLDEKLRKSRTKKEMKLLEKSSKIIPVPEVFSSSLYGISMKNIKGKRLSEFLDSLPNSLEICGQIGKNIAKLHDSGIIHGDLTTSNMILKNNLVYFIDFGLGFESHNVEDKAVDLHLIRQALEAKHPLHFKEFFNSLIKGYTSSINAKAVFKRLEIVEKRGRYKQAY